MNSKSRGLRNSTFAGGGLPDRDAAGSTIGHGTIYSGPGTCLYGAVGCQHPAVGASHNGPRERVNIQSYTGQGVALLKPPETKSVLLCRWRIRFSQSNKPNLIVRARLRLVRRCKRHAGTASQSRTALRTPETIGQQFNPSHVCVCMCMCAYVYMCICVRVYPHRRCPTSRMGNRGPVELSKGIDGPPARVPSSGPPPRRSWGERHRGPRATQREGRGRCCGDGCRIRPLVPRAREEARNR